MEFKDLLSYKKLQTSDSDLFSQVNMVYDLVKETINGMLVVLIIIQCMILDIV